jgi:DNA-binding response OmpR family regulator
MGLHQFGSRERRWTVEEKTKGRVLVVEDEATIGKTIRLGLEAAGFDVTLAEDGLDCLKEVRRKAPDLIILDVMLPKFDGFKVCRLLKFDKNTRHIPIILCSARNSEADRERGRKAGADDYVLKPFDLDALVENVRTRIAAVVGVAES